MTLIDTLRVAFAYCFYKVKITHKQDWNSNKIYYEFEFRPRKIPLLLLAIICSPFHIFLYGVISLFKTKIWKVEKNATYNLMLPNWRNVTKIEMYKKY